MDKIYYKLRKDEIRKAKVMLKRVKIDIILYVLSRCCWKNSIQYEVLLKNIDILEIKLKGSNEVVLLKFHKTAVVRVEEYASFLISMSRFSVSRGAYITTGTFDKSILEGSSIKASGRQVKLEDGFHFIKGQLGINESANSVFKRNRFEFYRYLPA